MKRHLVVALAALIILFFAAPSAFATIHIHWDPPTTDIACTNNQPCNVLQLDTKYTETWLGCDTPGIPDMSSTNPPFSPTYCLWFNNVTGVAANVFTFSFAVPEGAGGEALTCDSSPDNFAMSNCPDALPASGSTVTFTFVADPALPNSTDFYLATDFASQPDPGSVVVSVSVPEPGVLGLFGFGLLAIGVAYGWQRRRKARPVSAA